MYIYIYIYVCVCVCVCVLGLRINQNKLTVNNDSALSFSIVSSRSFAVFYFRTFWRRWQAWG